jgi:hypothetical protein
LDSSSGVKYLPGAWFSNQEYDGAEKLTGKGGVVSVGTDLVKVLPLIRTANEPSTVPSAVLMKPIMESTKVHFSTTMERYLRGNGVELPTTHTPAERKDTPDSTTSTAASLVVFAIAGKSSTR